MSIKVIVGDGESVHDALKRLDRALILSRTREKWPYLREFYAKPSMVRHRQEWINRKIRFRCWQR